MRNFHDFIEKILAKKYFFRIRTCEDLEYFTLGCFIAKEIYKQEDTTIEYFTFFYEYVNDIYKHSFKKNWGKVIDFYSGDNNDSFILFSTLYGSYVKDNNNFSQSMESTNPFGVVKKNLMGVDSFLKLILRIEEMPGNFGIKKLNDLDKIYMGLFAYADFDKGEALFKNLKDETFINFYEPDNNFKKYLVRENPILPVNDYLSIIKYLTTEENELEFFFQVFNEYLSSESCVAK